MPLFDFNSPVPADHLRDHDVVIVGAGAIGILLAVKLSQRGKRVLLLETGHFQEDDERQELNRLEETGKVFGNAIWHRKRALGGTTIAWGGQSLTFSPLDFEARDWVAGSGWPITYQDVAPWYPAANAFMGIDRWNYDTDLFSRLRSPNPGFDPRELAYHFSKWAPEPNFFKLYRSDLEKNVTVLYNAQLTRIDLGENQRVKSIAVTNFAGQTSSLPVNTLVLATGGIEANRTLLLNRHQMPGGIGNHSGHLGKAFMEHPCIDAGEIVPASPRNFQRSFATHYHRLRTYSVRLSSSAEWQKKHRLLNASAGMLFTYPDDTQDPFAALKHLVGRGPKAGLLGPRQLVQVAGSALGVLTDGILHKPGATVRLTLMLEQEPSARSYVALGKTLDRFGLPRAEVHWSMTDLAWRTARQFTRTIADELKRTGLGEVRLDPPFINPDPARDPFSYFSDVNHHMGGTRMSAAPADGVVNRDLQVWGVPNLYVSTCSVFPTGSHSNPTLTMLALSTRLVEKLAGQTA